MMSTGVGNDEFVAIAVLMGFSRRPADDAGAEELYRQCEAATFAFTPQGLPRGRWARQGYAFERAATITVRQAAAAALCRRRSGSGS